jgi:hypothetical protein
MRVYRYIYIYWVLLGLTPYNQFILDYVYKLTQYDLGDCIIGLLMGLKNPIELHGWET